MHGCEPRTSATRVTDPRAARGACTTSRSSSPTWNAPSASTRTCSSSHSPTCSRIAHHRGSNHFFFDIGNGNGLAFFDFPGLDLGPYAEVLGGLHHLAISVEPDRWERLVGKLAEARVEHEVMSGSSVYFRDPDGTRLELIKDPLGQMYGTIIL